MSASVIRRGLDLFNEKDELKSRKKNGDPRKVALKKPGVYNKQRARRGVSRQHSAARTNNTTVKDKKLKSALDEYKKKQKKSQLNSNLQYFLGTDKTRNAHAAEIIKQNVGRRACHQPEIHESKPEQKSVFSEKDFQKFQEEYFSKL